MKNYISLCIWGDGPGRPFDNAYILSNKIIGKNFIQLCFEGWEECHIQNPQNIEITDVGIQIGTADTIIWKFYCYGIPQNPSTLTITEYKKIDETYARVKETGYFQSEKMIKIKKKKAFIASGKF